MESDETMEHSILNGVPLSNSSYQGLTIYVEEEVGRLQELEVVDESKETVSSRHNSTDKKKRCFS